MVSILLPTTVPLHGILCHSHSDINMNLIASSELWKLICFLSIKELNTGVVFCYFHLPTINTTLVINKLRHLSYYWHNVIIMFFSLCFAYGLGDTLLCALLNSLPLALRHQQESDCFKWALKTHVFSELM